MARINIDNSKVVAFTNKLEKMRKSDLPVVINQTLNDAAFDVKTRSMPKSVKSTFTERNKSFFRSVSRVKKSSGFNINNQKSQVGFIGSGSKKEAVKGLEDQERGGTIQDRGFIANDEARTGKSNSRQVSAKNRLGKVKFIDARKSKGNTKKQKWMAAAFKSKETGVAVLGNHIGKGGARTVSRIRSIKRTKGGIKIKRTILYSYKEGRKIKVKATHFMRRASNESGLKIDNFFIKNAKKRIKLK
jgi:hypothetical protein